MHRQWTAEALTRLVYRYYPAGIHQDEPRYRSTEESQRLEALRRSAEQDTFVWRAFIQRLREAFSGGHVWDYPTILYNPAREARIAQPTPFFGTPEVKEVKEVVLLMSILAPVHFLYASHQQRVGAQWLGEGVLYPPFPAEYQPYEARLGEMAHATFGTVRLSNEVLFTPVPDLQVGNTTFGKVTLADCLFTDHRW